MKDLIESANAARPRVAVIGGGIAGLVCANHLSDLAPNVGVTVFESGEEFGGRGRTQTFSGAALNLGPHALAKNGALATQLRAWRIEPEGAVPRRARGYYEGRSYALPAGPVSLATTGLLPGWARFRLVAAMVSIVRATPSEVAGMSVLEYIEQLTEDERVRRMLVALARLATYAGELNRLSADVFVDQMQVATGGVLYLHDGWQPMVDSLVGRLRERGVELLSGQAVNLIEADASEAATNGVGLRVGERLREFDAVVVAASPGTAARLLGDAAAGLAGLDARPRRVRVACLDLVLNSWPDEAPDLTLGIDEPIYISNHSRTARLSEDGSQVVHCARYLDSSDSLDSSQVRAGIEEVLDHVFPDWRDAVVDSRYLPQMTAVEQAPSPETSGRAGRMPVSSASLPGIYFAGDWVGPRGWLSDAAAASAEAAAMSVAEQIAPQVRVRRAG
jgi:phytoene dehydrogenase-like protein